jgi:hypothetical protein
MSQLTVLTLCISRLLFFIPQLGEHWLRVPHSG